MMDAEEQNTELEEEMTMHAIEEAMDASRLGASSGHTKSGRGPSKGVHSKEPMFLEFNELDQPIGKWAHHYGVQVGACVLRTDINIPSYPKMDDVIKANYWEETKRLFHIQDPNGAREKKFHKLLGSRFRTFKSRLAGRWIYKSIKPPKKSAHLMPWEVYKGYITEEQWEEFKKTRADPKWEDKRANAQASASENKHPHHMGQMSYPRCIKKWEEEERIPPLKDFSNLCESTSSSSSTVSTMVSLRPHYWILGHEKKLGDGRWGIDPNEPETMRVASLIEKYILEENKEIQEGTFTREKATDALTKALGKPDRPGHVKALGGSVGYKQAFGKVSRNSAQSSYSSEDFEAMRVSLETKLSAEFEERFNKRVAMEEERFNERVALEVRRVMQQMSGLHMPTMVRKESPHISTTENEMANLVVDLEGPTTVHLAMKDDHGNLEVVAEGSAQPWANDVVDFAKMRKTHYMVILDNPYIEYDDIDLPIPMQDGRTKLGECHGSVVLWPAHLVLFDKKDEPPPKKKIKSKQSIDSGKKSGKDSCDPRSRESTMIRKEVESIVPNRNNIDDLGEECKLLHYMMSTITNHTTTIPLPASIFHYAKDTQTFVTNGDIMELLQGDRACISLIHVYMMFLFNEYIAPKNLSHISFLCPEKTAHAESMKDQGRIDVIQYIRDAFLVEGEKDMPRKWIIAPCHERNHWILMVIDLSEGLAYVFDSASTKPFEVAGSISVAYVAYWVNLAKGKKKSPSQRIKFIRMKCAQQSGVVECGYYVMKFMHEFVTSYNDCNDRLSQVYQSRDNPYSKKELDGVREEWAKFFLEKYLLPLKT